MTHYSTYFANNCNNADSDFLHIKNSLDTWGFLKLPNWYAKYAKFRKVSNVVMRICEVDAHSNHYERSPKCYNLS